jgi:hypothetical protein
MAITTIKATYSLDPEAVRTLERLAARWGVPKSEALRRAIGIAAHAEAANGPLAALDSLQAALALTPERAEQWAKAARAERSRASERSEGSHSAQGSKPSP